MVHFYAKIKGDEGLAIRNGTKQSGIRGDICGWDCGVHVQCSHIHEQDICTVYATSGINKHKAERVIAQIHEDKILLFPGNDEVIKIKK